MTDRTLRVAYHEAGHAVAAYSLGHPINTLQAWSSDGKMKHPVPKDRMGHVDHFSDAVIALAGEGFCDSIGLSKFGSDEQDKKNAARALVFGAPEDAPLANVQAGLAVVEQATRELVSSERFRDLALDLAGELAEKHFMIGSEIDRFLRQRDPHAKALDEARDAAWPQAEASIGLMSDWSPLGFRLPGTPGRGRREVAAYF